MLTFENQPNSDTADMATDVDASDTHLAADLLDPPEPDYVFRHGEHALQHKMRQFDLPPITMDLQAEDLLFRDIIHYLTIGKLPVNNTDARRILLLSEQYIIKNRLLYRLTTFTRKHRNALTPVVPQLCVPPKYRLQIMHSYHLGGSITGDHGLHCDSQKTYLSIRDLYFWPGMYEDIVSFARGCDVCQRIKYRRRLEAPMQHTPVYDIFQVLSIDTHGPVNLDTPASHPYKHVLLMMDLASGYTEFQALKTTSAKECAYWIYKQWFMRYSFVPRVLTDRSKSWLNEFTQTLFELSGVRHIKTSSYRPSSNPVELKNKLLLAGLRSYLTEEKDTWPDMLDSLRLAVNSTVQPQLGMSAFQFVFGVRPKLPIDLNILCDKLEQSTVSGLPEAELVNFQVLRDVLKMNIWQNKQITQHYQNKRSQPHNIRPGSMVYRINFGATTKQKDRCTGPYRVLYLLGNNAARLENVLTGQDVPTLVNVNHLLLARDRRRLYGRYLDSPAHNMQDAVSLSTTMQNFATDVCAPSTTINASNTSDCFNIMSSSLGATVQSSIAMHTAILNERIQNLLQHKPSIVSQAKTFTQLTGPEQNRPIVASSSATTYTIQSCLGSIMVSGINATTLGAAKLTKYTLAPAHSHVGRSSCFTIPFTSKDVQSVAETAPDLSASPKDRTIPICIYNQPLHHGSTTVAEAITNADRAIIHQGTEPIDNSLLPGPHGPVRAQQTGQTGHAVLMTDSDHPAQDDCPRATLSSNLRAAATPFTPWSAATTTAAAPEPPTTACSPEVVRIIRRRQTNKQWFYCVLLTDGSRIWLSPSQLDREMLVQYNNAADARRKRTLIRRRRLYDQR
jgi:hypothetical protein